ncbi:hypothetical protein AAFF_G00113540 [Aldrovandia affinis]|uniref:Uncharacterized protein n=1 Tax=Aldrovandia affinis TaxID=143900 RepID=A0AAD7RTE5_9TELE|nr:hypothetical protein AAFF_G00113540 [Aldrovandia affinis]
MAMADAAAKLTDKRKGGGGGRGERDIFLGGLLPEMAQNEPICQAGQAPASARRPGSMARVCVAFEAPPSPAKKVKRLIQRRTGSRAAPRPGAWQLSGRPGPASRALDTQRRWSGLRALGARRQTQHSLQRGFPR